MGAAIAPLQAAGVPEFAPLVDSRHYFDYHHLQRYRSKGLLTPIAPLPKTCVYIMVVLTSA
jgi:hypothetical protein